MPITVIVGIVCTTSSAMAATCNQNAVSDTSTTMLNTEPAYCASVSEIGYSTQSGTMAAAFGVYSCDTCYANTNLVTYTRVPNTIDTSDYGYDCGTVTYYTCNRRNTGGMINNTLEQCLSYCNSGTYCCPHESTVYSCPAGWEQNLSTHTCYRSETTSGENNAGYYTISYGSCDATGTTVTQYVVSQSGTVMNNGVPARCTSCS